MFEKLVDYAVSQKWCAVKRAWDGAKYQNVLPTLRWRCTVSVRRYRSILQKMRESAYFPTQKVAKTCSMMVSETDSPVSINMSKTIVNLHK